MRQRLRPRHRPGERSTAAWRSRWPAPARSAKRPSSTSPSAITIPDDIPLDIASLVGCGVTTGVGAALNTAKVEKGSTVLVIGCGGVGMNVIQGAKIAGASAIVAMDRFENKAEDAKRFGATHAATPETIDAIKAELTGGEGFDYAFEVIGLSSTIRAAFDATRKGGTTVVVGVGRAEDTVSSRRSSSC